MNAKPEVRLRTSFPSGYYYYNYYYKKLNLTLGKTLTTEKNTGMVSVHRKNDRKRNLQENNLLLTQKITLLVDKCKYGSICECNRQEYKTC